MKIMQEVYWSLDDDNKIVIDKEEIEKEFRIKLDSIIEEKTGCEEEEMDEAVDNHTFFRGDNVGRTVVKAKDVQGTREKASLKEGFDGAARFQKLANIKK